MSLLDRSVLRDLAGHPWQLALAILGIALGVAVVVGIDLANASATRAFDLATESIAGRATHQVTGGPTGLDETLYRDLIVDGSLHDLALAPVVEGFVTGYEVPGTSPEVSGTSSPASSPEVPGTPVTLRLLGVDAFAEAPFRPYLQGLGGGAGGGLGPFMTRPGAVVATAETARDLGVGPGEPFVVDVEGTRRTLEMVAVLDPGDERSRRALEGLLVADLATAQEVLGRVGRLDRLDVLAPADAADGREEALAELRRSLPAGASVGTAASRSQALDAMTRAFRLNLSALSLLALVCGMFLIYNTVTFSAVRRRTQVGVLRALGASRREIFRQVLIEALALGVAGTALGLGLGVLLAQGLTGLVTRTINDLFFVVSVRGVVVPPTVLVRAALLGLLATLGAALPPAFESTATTPRSVLSRSDLEARSRRSSRRGAWIGLALCLLGLVLLALPSRSLVVAFAGMFGVIVGCAFLAPAATVGLTRLAARPARRILGILGAMAVRGVEANLSRTGVAIAALTIAVSVTVGVGVMISSFRATVVDWLELSLPADVYVSPPAVAGRPVGTSIAPEAVEVVRATPGIERLNTLRSAEIDRGTDAAGSGPLLLIALELDERGRGAFDLAQGDPDEAWAAVERGAVLVSEPYAYRHDVGVGDTVELATDRGPRKLEVAGVYLDYGAHQGAVLFDLGVYRSLWDDPGVSGVSVFAAPGVDPDDLVARLRRATGGIQRLQIRSNRALTETSLAIFDRTFQVTEVLRLLAGLVAALGVLAALLALQLERSRELAVLRANGMTPRQVWKLVTAQSGLLGLAAGLLSLPVGLVLAAVMIYVINRRSFGWTLQMTVPPEILVQAVLLALAAALVAGLYPAWVMARTPPALALREE
jgi:putative ABC transport system permease protein